jgi:hypothetical protein
MMCCRLLEITYLAELVFLHSKHLIYHKTLPLSYTYQQKFIYNEILGFFWLGWQRDILMSLRRLGGSRQSLLALLALHRRQLNVLLGPRWRVRVVIL